MHATVEPLPSSARRRSGSWLDAMKASCAVRKTLGVANVSPSVIYKSPKRGALEVAGRLRDNRGVFGKTLGTKRISASHQKRDWSSWQWDTEGRMRSADRRVARREIG